MAEGLFHSVRQIHELLMMHGNTKTYREQIQRLSPTELTVLQRMKALQAQRAHKQGKAAGTAKPRQRQTKGDDHLGHEQPDAAEPPLEEQAQEDPLLSDDHGARAPFACESSGSLHAGEVQQTTQYFCLPQQDGHEQEITSSDEVPTIDLTSDTEGDDVSLVGMNGDCSWHDIKKDQEMVSLLIEHYRGLVMKASQEVRQHPNDSDRRLHLELAQDRLTYIVLTAHKYGLSIPGDEPVEIVGPTKRRAKRGRRRR